MKKQIILTGEEADRFERFLIGGLLTVLFFV